ncbi:MAG: aldo/keto reductase [Thermomicrobiales bacterium]
MSTTTDPLARRQFGSTPLMVPPIAIGCAPLGNMGATFGYDVTTEDAVATILRALDSPIPYIDTAALYGDGESERRVGLALKEAGGLPEGAVLQTKEGRDPRDNNYRGDTVKWRMERSLELLGVDHIDVVYLHDHEWTTFEEAMAPGGPVEVLRGFQEQGVFDYLGIAGGPIPEQMRLLETGLFDAVIHHNRYTLLNRSAEPLIDAAHARGMAVLNAAPYGSGMLVKGPDAYPRYAYQEASPEMVDRVRQYAAIAAHYEVPLAAVALQFSTRDPRQAVTIVGMSRPSRIDDTLRYLTTPIPDALWEEIAPIPFDMDDPEVNRYK